jgi:hypothetical protein
VCLDCGCNFPNERHGDARHITYSDLQQAAVASGVTEKKAAKNIRKTLKKASNDMQTAQTEFAWPTTRGGEAKT